jgi:hypothetical protein
LNDRRRPAMLSVSSIIVFEGGALFSVAFIERWMATRTVSRTNIFFVLGVGEYRMVVAVGGCCCRCCRCRCCCCCWQVSSMGKKPAVRWDLVDQLVCGACASGRSQPDPLPPPPLASREATMGRQYKHSRPVAPGVGTENGPAKTASRGGGEGRRSGGRWLWGCPPGSRGSFKPRRACVCVWV